MLGSRVPPYIPLTIVALCALYLGLLWPKQRAHHLDAGMSRVQRGDDKSVVLTEMGKPRKDIACESQLAAAPQGCSEEMLYQHPFAPWVAEYWLVYLDGDGKVLATNHVATP